VTLESWLWFGGKLVVVLGIVWTLGPLLTLYERKVSAWIQGRVGPNRVGPKGFLQPVADVIKLVFKEMVIPGEADKILFLVAPIITAVPPMLAWAVIPFGSTIGTHGLQLANLNIGVLFLMSVLSVAVYGVTLGGWSSNNKYSLLGSLRASAQLISYELTLGLTILSVVMITTDKTNPEASIGLQQIVMHQVEHGWNLFGGGQLWAVPSGIVAFFLMWTCALAENNRLPFDMAECEAELVGGYHTEYSSMGFSLFMISEYIAMVTMSALIVTLFLGGWSFPGLNGFLLTGTWLAGAASVGIFVGKIVFCLFCYLWIRWTLPRFRYDQIMQLGWKGLLPLAMINLAVLAVGGVFLEG
jgi:NADH-quinone oxidoreductase subunit H